MLICKNLTIFKQHRTIFWLNKKTIGPDLRCLNYIYHQKTCEKKKVLASYALAKYDIVELFNSRESQNGLLVNALKKSIFL